MIGRLRGEIVSKHPPQLLLDVGGVGYELEAPLSVFYDLPGEGETVCLFTHLVVREDAMTLFAFRREEERALFRRLLKVSGVGARMALAILSGMDAKRFAACVQHEDITALTRLPGIGKKTAQRLIVEMRDRLGGESAGGAVSVEPAEGVGAIDHALTDAIAALTALGYRPLDADRMARAAYQDGASSSEEIIRGALRRASGS